MKVRIYLIAFSAVLLVVTSIFAMEGQGHSKHSGAVVVEDKDSMSGHVEEVLSVIEVGNKLCPISGEKAGGMGQVVQQEYNGKVYNLCCAGCIDIFKKDPEKYVKIVEEQMAQQSMGGEGHDHSKHVMGKKDEHVMKETGEKSAVSTEKASSTAQIKEFDLEAYQFGYSPDTIVVSKGDVVKIHASSRDVPHGVFIKEYGVNVTVKKGSIEEIEFIADKAGEFDIICSVYCGRGHHGMKAKLIVKE